MKCLPASQNVLGRRQPYCDTFHTHAQPLHATRASRHELPFAHALLKGFVIENLGSKTFSFSFDLRDCKCKAKQAKQMWVIEVAGDFARY